MTDFLSTLRDRNKKNSTFRKPELLMIRFWSLSEEIHSSHYEFSWVTLAKKCQKTSLENWSEKLGLDNPQD